MLRVLIACLIFNLIVIPASAQSECALSPQLVIGGYAQVSPGQPNNMRDTPARSGEKVGEIPASAVATVLDGPTCADGFNWWQVDYLGTVGWTVEGADGAYWLNPVEPVTDYVPHIAYLHSEAYQNGIYDLNLDDMSITPLAGAGNIGRVSSVTWFPDGQSVAYIYFGMGGEGTPGRLAVRSLTAQTEDDHTLVEGEAFSYTIGVSPDGRTLANNGYDNAGNTGIVLRDFTTGENTFVPNSDHLTFAAWSPDGRYILAREEQEDSKKIGVILAVDGQEEPKALSALIGSSVNSASWSPDGAYLALEVIHEGIFKLALYEIATDRVVFLTGNETSVQGPDWSPDGSQIAYGGRNPGGNRSIYIYNLITGTNEQVTSEGDDYYPEYQPVPGAVTLDISPVFEVLWQDAQG